ncbi:unnamed protein product [Phaeothamnion confervicola]
MNRRHTGRVAGLQPPVAHRPASIVQGSFFGGLGMACRKGEDSEIERFLLPPIDEAKERWPRSWPRSLLWGPVSAALVRASTSACLFWRVLYSIGLMASPGKLCITAAGACVNTRNLAICG